MVHTDKENYYKTRNLRTTDFKMELQAEVIAGLKCSRLINVHEWICVLILW